ncbi:MrcB family domain-containing protein [Owenweeksia hongkongensis]|uniref:MrcB family domain-containing protein n=1 Tax=Owenweeksia hongkongensis TaxID=253245 RepID=UPI003A92B1E7
MVIAKIDTNTFADQLHEFIAQAKTSSQKTKHYKASYQGLKVNVSFGKGAPARIPWISFLKEPNTTSDGIYPVYLYYKENELLILAYGVSETHKPRVNWRLPKTPTVDEFYRNNHGKKPDRYGASYIFKTYDATSLPSDQTLNTDLQQIIDEYQNVTEPELRQPSKHFKKSEFEADLKKSSLTYSNQLTTRAISSLITKPFVILTGLSGSGKTKLAQAFVQWICQDKNQYKIIPVGADWTNREPLLGFPNALNPKEYIKPDSGALALIMKAIENPELPYFLILDEMNLSHVERYFADFLSVMESGGDIPLYSEGAVDNGVPAKLKIPSNLFIIGTVNIDETTNMFSPKVLDRANTIEFRISSDEMEGFLSNIREIDMNVLTAKGASMAASFVELSQNKKVAIEDQEEINQTLIKFFGELKKAGAEFGYRTGTEILRLINQLTVIDNTLDTNTKLDIAIMQKLLPKLHGSRRKLVPILSTLASFCVVEGINIVKDVFEKDEFDFSDKTLKYPLSLEKISRMYKGAIENGFASFAEA